MIKTFVGTAEILIKTFRRAIAGCHSRDFVSEIREIFQPTLPECESGRNEPLVGLWILSSRHGLPTAPAGNWGRRLQGRKRRSYEKTDRDLSPNLIRPSDMGSCAPLFLRRCMVCLSRHSTRGVFFPREVGRTGFHRGARRRLAESTRFRLPGGVPFAEARLRNPGFLFANALRMRIRSQRAPGRPLNPLEPPRNAGRPARPEGCNV